MAGCIRAFSSAPPPAASNAKPATLLSALASALSAAAQADGFLLGAATTAILGLFCGMVFSVGLMQRERGTALLLPVAAAAAHVADAAVSVSAARLRTGSARALSRSVALLVRVPSFLFLNPVTLSIKHDFHAQHSPSP